MPALLPLVGIAGKLVCTVASCAGIGAYARYQGIISEPMEKGLDKLISSIFLPCLILEKVTPNMNIAELISIWPLSLMCVLIVFYGLSVGAAVSRMLQAFHSAAFPKYRGLVMVASAFPNSFSVPLTMMLALGDEPILLANGQHGGDALAARVNMLFLMSYSVWVLARWSIGYPIMSSSTDGGATISDIVKNVLNPPVIACIIAACVGLLWNEIKENVQTSHGAVLVMLEPAFVALSYAGALHYSSSFDVFGGQATRSNFRY